MSDNPKDLLENTTIAGVDARTLLRIPYNISLPKTTAGQVEMAEELALMYLELASKQVSTLPPVNVDFKRLYQDAKPPFRGRESDAGVDLTIHSINIPHPEDYRAYIEVGLGISVNIPEGYYGQLVARSSITKTNLMLANAFGVIDAGFTGELKARFVYTGSYIAQLEEHEVPTPRNFDIGMRVCQLIILPIPCVKYNEVQEHVTTNRGSSGWGSTGAK